jgi:hypothetical protein
VVNDPAQRLLGLDAAAVGQTLEDLMPSGRLRDVLLGVGTRPDHLVLTDDHALVVNRQQVILAGRPHGALVTLRDRTEMAALLRERDGERGLMASWPRSGLGALPRWSDAAKSHAAFGSGSSSDSLALARPRPRVAPRQG